MKITLERKSSPCVTENFKIQRDVQCEKVMSTLPRSIDPSLGWKDLLHCLLLIIALLKFTTFFNLGALLYLFRIFFLSRVFSCPVFFPVSFFFHTLLSLLVGTFFVGNLASWNSLSVDWDNMFVPEENHLTWHIRFCCVVWLFVFGLDHHHHKAL